MVLLIKPYSMIQKMPRRFKTIPTIKMAAGGTVDPDLAELPMATVNSKIPKFKRLTDTSTINTGLDTSLPSAPTSFTRRTSTPKNTLKPTGPAKQPFQMPDLGSVIPFASNIANAFRKVPAPMYPNLNTPPSYQKINMDDARYRVSREINATNENADRTLDSNTAQSVKQYNLGQKLNQFSSITEAEKNTNAGIANRQADAVAQTQAGNNAKLDEYNNEIVGSKIAQQREQSANLANAADKFVSIRNERAKNDLERDKTRTLATMFSTDGPSGGLFNRNRLAIADTGAVDPLTGKRLTQDEINTLKGTNNTPVQVNAPASTIQSQTTTQTPTQDRVPSVPKMAAGYPYTNTQLPTNFTTPNSQIKDKMRGYSSKYRAMGGILSKMKPVKY